MQTKNNISNSTSCYNHLSVVRNALHSKFIKKIIKRIAERIISTPQGNFLYQYIITTSAFRQISLFSHKPWAVTYLLVLMYLQKLLSFFAGTSSEQYKYSFLNLKLYSLNHLLYFPCYSCTQCMILIAEIQKNCSSISTLLWLV